MREGVPEKATLLEQDIAALHTLWRVKLQSQTPGTMRRWKRSGLHDRSRYPDCYEHIWEGDYARAFEGAYYAQALADARAQGRIGRVAAD